MQDLMRQAQVQMIDLVNAWKSGNVNQRQEMVKGLLLNPLDVSRGYPFAGWCLPKPTSQKPNRVRDPHSASHSNFLHVEDLG